MLTTATYRPPALTPQAHLSVPAIKASQETAYPVQVITMLTRIQLLFIDFDVFDVIGRFYNLMFLLPFIHTDIDECTSNSHNCHASLATCKNTFGSFKCNCIQGYTGDGVLCLGDTYIYLGCAVYETIG